MKPEKKTSMPVEIIMLILNLIVLASGIRYVVCWFDELRQEPIEMTAFVVLLAVFAAVIIWKFIRLITAYKKSKSL